MQIPTLPDQIPTESPLWGKIWGFGTNGDSLFALFGFVGSMGGFNSRRYNKGRATIINIFLLEATEEVEATVKVGVTLVLSTPKNFFF